MWRKRRYQRKRRKSYGRPLERQGLPPGVEARFVGQQEDFDEASNFLLLAFVSAVLLVFLVLVTQLNNIYQALVVMR
jgi:multidrug efflux pump